jgi:hypothetical protein
VTESSLLHMIFVAGLHAIREKAEEEAYATAAADRLASERRTNSGAQRGGADPHGRTRIRPAVTDLLRGRIYRARLAHTGEDQFFLVVSTTGATALSSRCSRPG